MYDISDCGLLIVAYARAGNVKQIINTAKSAGVKRIYIALDISENDSDIQEQQIQIRDLVFHSMSQTDVSINLLERTSNIGCSANLLSGVDWVFEFEDYVAVVEDDCLPVKDFYSLILKSRVPLETDANIWIVGGTQLMPRATDGRAVLSRYPITWGWATTRSKWAEIRSALIEGSETYVSFRGSGLRCTESLYWRTGARRSYRGFNDAWDIPFALAFITHNKFCILPSESLIKNVGDDSFALHTTLKSSGIKLETGRLQDDLDNLERSISYEAWIRESHYKIRRRYVVTNLLRRFWDFFAGFWETDVRKPLLQRWQEVNP